MANDAAPEPWLRGPVPGIPALLQPAAHAFQMACEHAEEAVAGLTESDLWARPGGVASPGFHLAHLAGSTDRLLTYARGERLSEKQKEALVAETRLETTRPSLEQLLESWRAAVDRALVQLAATSESSLFDSRPVGRQQLPSNVIGLLFHAAEHAMRHTGQLVTTARIVKASRA